MPGKITMENFGMVFGSVPVEEGQAKTIQEVTNAFLVLVEKILFDVPDCAHRSAALRDILQAKMVCVDAIAKGGIV